MSDAGVALVERVRATFEPDPAFVRAQWRGFRWWPGLFAQRIVADEPERRGGFEVHRVSAECVLVSGVSGGATTFAVLAETNMREAGSSAVRWNSETGEVSLHASVYLTPGQEDAAGTRLLHAALLQLGDAARLREPLARALGGTPVRSR